MSETLIASRDPKGIHAVSIFEAAYNQSGLTDDRAQRLNENGGEFKKRMMALIRELSATDLYKHLWVPSKWTYPPEYNGPKDFHKQCEILMGILPGLDPEPAWVWYNDVYSKLEKPKWVEGVFAVPSEFALARQFHPDIQDRAAAYCASSSLLLGKIAESRLLYDDDWESEMDKSHLWRTDHTMEMLDSLWELQGKPDIILLSAQLGLRHRGSSVMKVRDRFVDEFGAGLLEGLAIALTHPKRYVHWEQLHMDFPGDYFSSVPDDLVDEAPCMSFYKDSVVFCAKRTDDVDDGYGSMSCWLPPQ